MNDDITDQVKPIASLADVRKTMSAIEGLVNVLGPLESEERHRVIQGALVVLGEKQVGSTPPVAAQDANEELEAVGLSPRARLWMRQNDLTEDQLLHVFDISDGAATVIAAGVSGRGNSEKTIKAYVLTGIASLLSSGDPSFGDKTARALCETLGCYDSTNHSRFMKEKGNSFSGSKDTGWKLTAPGLKFGASVVKEIATA